MYHRKEVLTLLCAFVINASGDSPIPPPPPVSPDHPVDHGPIGAALPICKGKNEEAISCKYPCPPNECIILYAQFLCIENQRCEPGCVCKKGYLRTNSTGVCVPEDRCLPPDCANDPNAIRGCGDRCKKTCKDYKDTKKRCKAIACSLYGCDCRDGFVYDENVDICVRPKDCSPQCYGQNERYDTCANANCSPQSCDDLGFPIACPSVTKCKGACLCKEGFVRNKRGVCIPNSDCPSCGGDPNAVSGCGVNCGKRCQDVNATGPVACPAICHYNGCDCRDNFFYNDELRRCVDKKSCPDISKKCKDPNAQWVSCAVNCPTDHCPKNDGPDPVCDPPYPCPGGCKCKLGYRLLNGKCILAENCPKVTCTRRNEVWATCPECLAEDCSNKNDPPVTCNTLVHNCQPKCICRKGTFRNVNGTCVPACQCP